MSREEEINRRIHQIQAYFEAWNSLTQGAIVSAASNRKLVLNSSFDDDDTTVHLEFKDSGCPLKPQDILDKLEELTQLKIERESIKD